MDPNDFVLYRDVQEDSYTDPSPGSIDALWRQIQHERAIQVEPQIPQELMSYDVSPPAFDAPFTDPSDRLPLDPSSSLKSDVPGRHMMAQPPLSALQDYQMQLMLLEQQKKKRQMMAKEEEDSQQTSTQQAPNALSDFHMQLMLLEQQNRKRLMMAKAEQASQQMAPAPSVTNRNPPVFSQNYGNSPMSNFASPASFMSGSSPASFMTARSTHASPAFSSAYGLSPAIRIETIREDEVCDPSMPAPLQKVRNDYYAHLHEQNIIQPFDKELNWSGKGQHVTFLPKELVPLRVLSHLGASMTAKVDKVLCKRIALARKTMRCTRQWTISEALGEVYHLQNLRHHHIIQLVGSYLQGRDFSILVYPVADCHLGTFLEDTADMNTDSNSRFEDTDYRRRLSSLVRSFACLTSALSYVHDQTTRHMDIKPQNILVREADVGSSEPYRVYLADFGLSQSFASQDHSQTDGPTSRTPRYCAPEVYQHERHGRAADIFSLGCVFAEIFTVLEGRHPNEFAEYRRGEGHDESFHANLESVNDWLDDTVLDILSDSSNDHLGWYDSCGDSAAVRVVLKRMISHDPDERPTARDMQRDIPFSGLYQLYPCCSMPPEQYVAYEATSADDLAK